MVNFNYVSNMVNFNYVSRVCVNIFIVHYMHVQSMRVAYAT